jgi:hypothetical protein
VTMTCSFSPAGAQNDGRPGCCLFTLGGLCRLPPWLQQ